MCLFKTVNCVITHIPSPIARRSFILYIEKHLHVRVPCTANKQARDARTRTTRAPRWRLRATFLPNQCSVGTGAGALAHIVRSPIFMCFCLTCVCVHALRFTRWCRAVVCVCVCWFCKRLPPFINPMPAPQSAERHQPAAASSQRRRRRRCLLIPFSALECSSYFCTFAASALLLPMYVRKTLNSEIKS